MLAMGMVTIYDKLQLVQGKKHNSQPQKKPKQKNPTNPFQTFLN